MRPGKDGGPPDVCGRLRTVREDACLRAAKILTIAIWLVFAASSLQASARDIYPAPQQAKADLAAALKTAVRTHKRILLDFGGNWCPDCQVLDIYFHNATNLPILQANFILVRINIGMMDANVDLASRYGIPLQKGVPALAVLSDRGRLLYSQKTGEFEKMGSMESSSVTRFLLHWKPVKPGCSIVAVTC